MQITSRISFPLPFSNKLAIYEANRFIHDPIRTGFLPDPYFKTQRVPHNSKYNAVEHFIKERLDVTEKRKPAFSSNLSKLKTPSHVKLTIVDRKKLDRMPKQKRKPLVKPPRAKKSNTRRVKGNMQSSKRSSAPVAISQSIRTSIPQISANAQHSRIRHKELVFGNLVTTSAFSVQYSFNLNPGLSAVFPWLSTQAVGWEHYKFHNVIVHYVSRCPTSVSGTVFIAPDYDALDSGPTTEAIISTYNGLCENNVWEQISCRLNPAAMNVTGSRKFVRTSTVPANADARLYDSGVVYIATNDGPTSAVGCGKIWVEYDVEFFNAQLPPAGAGQAGSVGSGSSPTPTSMFGTTSLPSIVGPYQAAGNTLTFLVTGTYLVTLQMGGVALTTSSATFSTSTATVTNRFGGTNFYINGASGSATAGSVTYLVTATQGQTIVWGNWGTLLTSIAEVTLWIGAYSASAA